MKYTPHITFFVLFIFLATTNDAQAVVLLESSIIEGDNPSPEAYLSNLYQIGVGIAAVLAVVMIVWGGIEYIASSANPSSKESAKKRIWAAIGGLLLALLSFLILQTINPSLVGGGGSSGGGAGGSSIISEGSSGGGGGSGSGGGREGFGGGSGGGDSGGGGSNFTKPLGVDFKTNACANNDCRMDPDLANKLTAFVSELEKTGHVGNEGIQVTELNAFSGHLNNCHGGRTCVDINFKNRSQDTGDIITAQKAAQNAGAYAIYEVSSQEAKDGYEGAGVKNVIVADITAPHFSFYKDRNQFNSSYVSY